MIKFFVKKYLKNTLNGLLNNISADNMKQKIAQIEKYEDKIKSLIKFLDQIKLSIIDKELSSDEIDILEEEGKELIKEIMK